MKIKVIWLLKITVIRLLKITVISLLKITVIRLTNDLANIYKIRKKECALH